MITLHACTACGHTVYPARKLCHRCGGAAWNALPCEAGVVAAMTAVHATTLLAEIRTPPDVRVIARLHYATTPGTSVALHVAEDGALGEPSMLTKPDHPFAGLIDPALLRRGDDVPPRHAQDALRLPPTPPDILLLPRTTQDLADIMRLCHQHGTRVVVQGGLTGLAGGAHPKPGEIALSLDRMRGVEEVDQDCATLTALAGTPLQEAQEPPKPPGSCCPSTSARGLM